MKIAICNVPLRSDKMKTNYPPLGAIGIIQSLQAAGYDTVFYDINFLRPSDDEIGKYFTAGRFDIVGISATVSTSYKFVKRLVDIIRAASPRTMVMMGGRLAASSEVVLKFTPIDYCVVGEGENIVLRLMDYVTCYGPEVIEEELAKVKGICFTDNSGKARFTGYDRQPTVDEIRDPDYGILEHFSDIDNYIHAPFHYEQFKHDRRSFQDHRSGKKLATVVSARGCVHQCAFCHRWQRGIKIFPVDRVICHIKDLADRFNVGFISFGDENFGASRKWTEEFIEKISPIDILYRVGGICAENVDADMLKRLKKSGCVAIHYGFESGSNRILAVMEKRSNVEANVKAALWTQEADLQTVPALVVGMPGESYATVQETTDFVKRITERLPRPPTLSINALVALPGTPVYEYARLKGLVGKTLDDEEKYLLKIADRGGSSMSQINLTDYPYFIVQSWIRCIAWAAHYNYYAKKGPGAASKSIFSNPVLFRMRYIIAFLLVSYKSFREDGPFFLKRCVELMGWPFRKKRFKEYVPLRTLINKECGVLDHDDIRVLRLGR